MDEYPTAMLTEGIDIGQLLSSGGARFEINNENIDLDDDFDDDTEDNEDNYDLSALQTPWKAKFGELKQSMKKIPDYNIYKRVTVAGEGETVSNKKARIYCHYNMFLEGKSEAFDSSYLRGAQLVTSTEDQTLLPGFLFSLQTMQKGEEAQFVINYELMFGKMGCPPRVEPKADILMVVQLKNFVEIGDGNACTNLPEQDRKKFPFVFEKSKEVLKKAADLFQQGRYTNACRAYDSAVSALEMCNLANETEQKQQRDGLIKLYTLLTECYLKMEQWKKVCSMYNELNRISNVHANCTAILNNGIALGKLGEYENSIVSLRKAQKLQPHNTNVNAALNNVLEQQDKYRKNMKSFWQRSMNIVDKVEKKSDEKEHSKFKTVFMNQMKNFLENEKTNSLPLIGLTNDDIKTVDTMLANDVTCKFKITENHNGETEYSIEKTKPN